jgi:hypothetical protein
VILTWFKLRQRDLGAILNASGWAINRPMRFSIKRARGFTICAPCRVCRVICWLVVVLAIIGAALWLCCPCTKCCKPDENPAPAPAAETPAPAPAS